jgi:hypothetical protein
MSGYLTSDDTLFEGKERGTEGIVSLFRFLFIQKYSLVYLSSPGNDGLICGSTDYPCLTLKNSLTHFLSELGPKHMKIMEEVGVGEMMMLTNVAVSPSSSVSTHIASLSVGLDESKGLSFAMGNVGMLSFDRIHFESAASIGNDVVSLISSSGSSLSLNTSSFVLSSGVDGEISYSQVTVSAGTLDLNGIILTPAAQRMFSSSFSAFVLPTSNTITITLSHFSNLLSSDGFFFVFFFSFHFF